MKGEALYRTVWRPCFERGYGFVVRHYGKNEHGSINICLFNNIFKVYDAHCPLFPASAISLISSMYTATHLWPIHTMRHVSVPSSFHLRSVRMVCVHTARRVQSPSRIAHDRRPAIISIKYAAHCHGMYFPLFVNY